MFDGMRAASKNWIGRVIMALLLGAITISFVIWGVGDVVRSIGQGKVAQVGGADVSTEAYRYAYQNELQQLQRRLRRNITNEEARRAGLDQQILSRLVTEAALDQKSRAMKLSISDDQVAAMIAADPSFKDPNGRFDKTRFDQILRDNGYNERAFVREQRATYTRREIADGVAGQMTAPEIVTAAVDRFRNETRSVDYVELTQTALEDIAAPAPDVLQAFYDAQKTSFAAPEYRKLVVLALNPAELAAQQTVSDEDAMKLYQSVAAQRFGAPEKRAVQQMMFPNEADAKTAYDKIQNGGSFDAIVSERQLAAKDVDLGLVTESQMADPTIAKAAFSLKPNDVSPPISGVFGSALLRVTAIQPGSVKPYSDVSAALKQEIATNRAKQSVQALHDKVEDLRASGKPLAEASDSLGLQILAINAVDQQGKDKSGAIIPSLAPYKDLLAAAFASDIGVDNATLETRGNGYLWFEVLKIEPARQLTFDEARETVLANWRRAEAQKQLSETANALVEKIRAGGDLAKLAAEEKYDLKHNGAVKRTGAEGLDEATIIQIFDQPNHGAGAATTPKGRIVFQVLDAAAPDFNAESEENKSVAAQMRQQIADDVLSQYILQLERGYGVKIYDSALRAAAGGADQ